MRPIKITILLFVIILFPFQILASENYVTSNVYTQSRAVGASEDQSGYGNIKISGLVIVEFELE